MEGLQILNSQLFAHSANRNGEWHKLEDHLVNTAQLAQELCKVEKLKDIAYTLGIVHDLGKSYQDFQDRLTGINKESFNHPGLSVFLIQSKLPEIQLNAQLEEIIHGHHRGLETAGMREYRLEARSFGIPVQVSEFIESIRQHIRPIKKQKISFHDSLYLSGCLFTADWLDTGKHFLTYEKRSRGMTTNTEENIQRYIDALSK